MTLLHFIDISSWLSPLMAKVELEKVGFLGEASWYCSLDLQTLDRSIRVDRYVVV
jgi:hypothetical protein